MREPCVLVTGGAGFIGSNFVHQWLREERLAVVNLDRFTYAGNVANLADLTDDSRHTLVRGDICDFDMVSSLFRSHSPKAIIHFAAESHVDRSILGPAEFVRTNVNGTFSLLEAARAHLETVSTSERNHFRFLHVSTDEVYGSLGPQDPPFSEDSPHRPNSPYSASKASADHLVRAYSHTYGMPTLTVNCSNNYGPHQFPEKLIPLMILNAVEGKPLPVYGDGLNVRDWLYVEDHCTAIRAVLARGRVGETYNIGGAAERANLDVVQAVCDLVDEMAPSGKPRRALITFVKDRPGHDRRYAIDARKTADELGWRPTESFESGLRKTVRWYLEHRAWAEAVRSGAYRDWMALNYEARGAS